MQQTVLVTGASGFIAKHIVLQLLNAGHNVVGSMRSTARDAELRDAVTPHLTDATDLENRLRTIALDLGQDDGWADAMGGIDVLMHTASPFPLVQPKDESEVIRPAVDGALRALKAAHQAGIKRVIFTSSTVAVTNTTLPAGKTRHDEDDWSDLDSPGATPYLKSKTIAERAAWDFAKTEAPEMELTVINPGFVLGAPLDKNYGTSIKVIERALNGTDPMIPHFGFSTVDVRDVAEVHLRAMTDPSSIGKRHVCVSDFLWFQDMTKLLANTYPNRKIATRRAPNLLVRFLGLFDPAIKSIVPLLGKRQDIDNARITALLGRPLNDPRDAALQSAAFLVDHGLVKP